MVPLFVSHIRPLLEYCSTVWNLGFLGDLRKLESVQRSWTRQVDGLESLSYLERMKRLGLYSIYGRMLRTDIIKIWKIFHSEVDVGLAAVFERRSHAATRGHPFKLSVPICRTELGRRFFGSRCVTHWNRLPSLVVSADSLETFKGLLDASMGDMFYYTCV